MEWVFFLSFALLAGGAAVGMVWQRNPVYSALLLILALFAQGGLYILLHAQLIAAVHIIVYAGAIMVLFLFVIMLLDLRREEGPRMQFNRAGVLLGLLLAGLLLAELALALGPRILLGPQGPYSPETLKAAGSTQAVGRILFREYLIPFELTSLILLAAMVGAMVLAKREPE
ncbi:MAG: NADH-quinone oxidoreductase subunit J [Candidatus Methylomirabilales bacterium]